MLNGKPLPWDLQEAVSLIEDELWDAGPEAVAERIREIEARFALKGALAEVEQDIARSHAQRMGIGGNNPPEAIDDLPEVPPALQIIWQPFAELKDEVEKETPDTDRVSNAISKLTALLASCGKWSGKKLDIAATEFAKDVGKHGWKVVAALIASHSPQINAVWVAAKDWLMTLLG